MADSWGPAEHPQHRAGVRPFPDGGGDDTQADEHGGKHAPVHSENYNATDGRHNRADHQGWQSVDPYSGRTSDTDFEEVTSRFEDGPGAWRQT